MSSFEDKLLRLKKSLDLYKDKEISELLGLNQKSLSARKSRNAFPEEKLLALTMSRPELRIDLEYVLTGKPSGRMTRAEAKRLGVLKPAPYIANAITSVKDDDDESRDDEPFTMQSNASGSLSQDEQDLLELFRNVSLTTKAKVVQMLIEAQPTNKNDNTIKGSESTSESNSTQNFHGKVKAKQIAARDIVNHDKKGR